MEELPSMQKKIVLLGDLGAGKSSLSVRYSEDQFDENKEPTITTHFITKTIKLKTHKVKLDVWDTAGEERYKSVVPTYYRSASGAIVVYDINDKGAFEKAKFWIKELFRYGEKDIIIFLVANKSDLEHKADSVEASKYCELNCYFYFETSAKTGENVVNIFDSMARKFEYEPRRGPEPKPFVIGLEEIEKNSKKSGCC
ncbi:ras-related protein rab-5c [Anaeramoeba flamelloides]|uniref:Ras-related protein rab-5c n=1 Tax=Anaeramoeba flamelloides TaxID=1746091 RepID=A0AAV8A9L8_9EUKA|nr:ras-related protein rab-5c [Anaeramoeba flamelloides]